MACRVMGLWPVLVCICLGSSWACYGIFFSRLTDKAVKDYSAYRSSLLFWALVDLIYNMFKVGLTGFCEGVKVLCCWL